MKRIHGKSRTSTYKSWKDMWQRCSNPKDRRYSDYGGRGIEVSLGWKDFQVFWSDMGEKPKGCSLERINNNGNYEPLNCRWATQLEQQNNKRTSRFLTWKGETMTMAQWSRKLRVTLDAFRSRIAKGWAIERAFTQPYKKRTRISC